MLCDGNFFSRSKTEVEQTSAILSRSIETLNTNFPVERYGTQRPGHGFDEFAMKTTIIFNFHTAYYAGSDAARQ